MEVEHASVDGWKPRRDSQMNFIVKGSKELLARNALIIIISSPSTFELFAGWCMIFQSTFTDRATALPFGINNDFDNFSWGKCGNIAERLRLPLRENSSSSAFVWNTFFCFLGKEKYKTRNQQPSTNRNLYLFERWIGGGGKTRKKYSKIGTNLLFADANSIEQGRKSERKTFLNWIIEFKRDEIARFFSEINVILFYSAGGQGTILRLR